MKYAKPIAIFSLLASTVSTPVWADTDVFNRTGYGATRSEACASAKAYVPLMGWRITGFGPCDCSADENNRWTCNVDIYLASNE